MTRRAAGVLLLWAWVALAPAAGAQEATGAGPPRIEPAAAAADSIRYSIAISDANRIGITFTNYGFLGNNFNSRAPSFEFPLGAGYEHMSRAGLWVGARAISDTGAFIGVSSAIVDNSQGSSSARASRTAASTRRSRSPTRTSTAATRTCRPARRRAFSRSATPRCRSWSSSRCWGSR